MKQWFLALFAGVICLALAVSAGWLWQSHSDSECEAVASILILREGSDDTVPLPREIHEADVLAPEVLNFAVERLQELGYLPVAEASGGSPTEQIIARTQVCPAVRGNRGETEIHFTASDAAEALAVTQALLDAFLESLNLESSSSESGSEAELEELQVEREKLQEAINRQKRNLANLNRQLESLPAELDESAVDSAALESELARIRREHRDAALRLAEARRDIDHRLAAESVASRIPDATSRSRVLARVEQLKIQSEFRRWEQQQQKWSKVYGRNHPRMVELREKMEALQKQLSDLGSTGDDVAASEPSSPSAIVLAAFESESSGLDEAEKQLASRLGQRQAALDERHELESLILAGQKELEFLEGEIVRNSQDAANLNRPESDIREVIVTPPVVEREALGSGFGLPMAVSCFTGGLVYLVILSRIRSRSAARRVAEESAPPHRADTLRDRFPTPEEERQLRLRLSARRGT
jgi:hypothetical protein